MCTDELCCDLRYAKQDARQVVHHQTVTEVKPALRKRKPRSRWKLYRKNTKKGCKKAWTWGVKFWDWLGSEGFWEDEIEFWRRVLRLKYILSSLLLLVALVSAIRIFVVLLK